jgi:hypothetical protein
VATIILRPESNRHYATVLFSRGLFQNPVLRNSPPHPHSRQLISSTLAHTDTMAPVKKSKSAKTSESINTRLQLVVKSGKVSFRSCSPEKVADEG